MTLLITHKKTATLPDQPGVEVNKAEWNDTHAITGTLSQSQNNVAVDGVTITGDGTPGAPLVATNAGYVPYIGANSTVDINTQQLILNNIQSYDDTLTINASSGDGLILNMNGNGFLNGQDQHVRLGDYDFNNNGQYIDINNNGGYTLIRRSDIQYFYQSDDNFTTIGDYFNNESGYKIQFDSGQGYFYIKDFNIRGGRGDGADNGALFTLIDAETGKGEWQNFTNGVTSITADSPLTGGTITTSGNIGIQDSRSDGSTKGAATFTAADFNDNGSGIISLDYTNGQKASASVSGFLSTTDWSAFNAKVSGSGTATRLAYWSGTSSLTSSANLFWDNTNTRLGIGTASPAALLHIQNATTANMRIQTTGNSTTGRSLFQMLESTSDGWEFSNNIDLSGNRDFKISHLDSLSRSFNLTILRSNGNVGILTQTPTAKLHIAAGTATANTAPLKLDLGTNLTTPEAGAIEYDGTQLYFSPSTTRNALIQDNGIRLTSGRVPFATTSGYLNDSSALTFSAGTLSATTFSGALTGNASTATALQNARTINGVSFDGTANIIIPVGIITLSTKFTDTGNSTTTETDLYSYTTAAGRLANNGERIEAEYGGVFVSSGTATRQLRVYFGGTSIFDSGALTLSLSSAWTVYVTVTRVSSSVVRYMISLTTQGAALSAYTAVGEVTGLTLSNTNIIKITGQAAGVGAATDDIVAKIGSVTWIG